MSGKNDIEKEKKIESSMAGMNNSANKNQIETSLRREWYWKKEKICSWNFNSVWLKEIITCLKFYLKMENFRLVHIAMSAMRAIKAQCLMINYVNNINNRVHSVRDCHLFIYEQFQGLVSLSVFNKNDQSSLNFFFFSSLHKLVGFFVGLFFSCS